MPSTSDRFEPRANRQAAKHKGCIGKERCGEKRARQRARVLRDKGDPVHAYPCPFCCAWHVGADWNSS